METKIDKLNYKLYCRECERKQNMGIIAHHKISSDPEEFYATNNFFIVQCLGCDTIGFAEIYRDETMFDYEKEEFYDEITVYPEKPKISIIDEINKYRIGELENVDPEILELFNQVVEMYNKDYKILCGSGLRFVLERLCLKKNILNGRQRDESMKVVINSETKKPVIKDSIEGKIYGLLDAELITPKHCEILQKVRRIGNDYVHGNNVDYSREVLMHAIRITEEVIKMVYGLEKNELLKLNK